MRSRSLIVMLALAAGLTLAACGSSSKSGASSPPPTTTAPPAASTAPGGQHLTVTPSQGLKSPATVQVTASGFSPGASLVVTQCANKGNATGPGDCNLADIRTVTANSTGQIATQFTVVKGPFGTNHIVCGSSQSCLVSVNPATTSPTQEADAPISFA
jgi:ABC-type glycerol-3-phosphate transport system substrate-binding protein